MKPGVHSPGSTSLNRRPSPRAFSHVVVGEVGVSCTEICGVPDARVTVLAKENHQHHGSTP